MKELILFFAVIIVAPQVAAANVFALPDPTRPDTSRVEKNKLNPTAEKKKPDKVLFSLQQIIISPSRKSVTINGKVLSIGDEIAGATLISISDNKVFLQQKRKLIELRLISQQGIKEVSR